VAVRGIVANSGCATGFAGGDSQIAPEHGGELPGGAIPLTGDADHLLTADPISFPSTSLAEPIWMQIRIRELKSMKQWLSHGHAFSAFHANKCRSRVQYWIASNTSFARISALPARSARVRVILRIRSWARAEKFIISTECSRSPVPSDWSLQCSRTSLEAKPVRDSSRQETETYLNSILSF